VIERLERIAHHDWKNSHPLDLSDEGLFDDLEFHGEGGSEKLALNIDEEKIKKHLDHEHSHDHEHHHNHDHTDSHNDDHESH